MAVTPARRAAPGLTVQALAEAKLIPAEMLADWGVTDTIAPGGVRAVAIQYRHEDGSPARSRLRLKLRDGDPPQGRSRFEWASGQEPIVPYGCWRLQEARETGYLLLVEGESDCWTLWRHHYPALGIPGVQMVNKLGLHHVAWTRTIYVVRERDRKAAGSWPGQDFVRGLRERLEYVSWRGRYVVIEMPDGMKDPSDLHVALEGRHEAFREALERCMSIPVEVVEIGADVEVSDEGPPVLPGPERVPPYPVDALPGPLARLVRTVADETGFLPDTVAVPLLAFTSAAIGATRRLVAKDGALPWREMGALWTATVLPSGAGKTPAGDLMRDLAVHRELALAKLAEEARDEYEARLMEYEAARAEWLKDARKGQAGIPPTKPEEPPELQFLVDDITPEALAAVLAHNPRGVLVAPGELAEWAQGFDRYRGKAAGERPFWLALWDGRFRKSNRKAGGTVRLRRPFVALTGPLPPGLLGALRHEAGVEDGLVPRLLIAYPDPAPLPKWRDEEIDTGVVEAARTVFDRLFSLEMLADMHGDPMPKDVGMTAPAKALFVRFHDENRDEVSGLPEEATERSFLGKGPTHVLRLALVLHLARWTAGEEPEEAVGSWAVGAAIEHFTYFRAHHRKALARMDRAQEDERAEALFRWILERRPEGVTARDLVTYRVGGIARMDDAEAALHDLEQRLLVRRVEDDRPGRGRRATRFIPLRRTA